MLRNSVSNGFAENSWIHYHNENKILLLLLCYINENLEYVRGMGLKVHYIGALKTFYT